MTREKEWSTFWKIAFFSRRWCRNFWLRLHHFFALDINCLQHRRRISKFCQNCNFHFFFLQDGQVQMMLKTCSVDSDESFTRDTIGECNSLRNYTVRLHHQDYTLEQASIYLSINWIWFKMQLFRIFKPFWSQYIDFMREN